MRTKSASVAQSPKRCLEPSRGRDTHRCASATPPSRPRDTGSSPYKSYPLVSSDSSPPRDLLGGMTGEVEVETTVSRTRSRPTARFLKGPVSLVSLAVAARLPGKALAVYLAIVHRRDLTHEPTVTLPSTLLREFGVDRDSKARASGVGRRRPSSGRTHQWARSPYHPRGDGPWRERLSRSSKP